MKHKAAFVEPMLLLPSSDLPDGTAWLYELKLDGYRAIAFKSGGEVHLRSRNDNDFNKRYPAILKALSAIPDETVIDGEIVATDVGVHRSTSSRTTALRRRPSFITSSTLMVLSGDDVMGESLESRRALLEREVLPKLADPIRDSPKLKGSVADLVQSVKAHGLEGLIAKRRAGRYEPGQRSGAWRKMRVNRGQEFVIGGYTVAGATFDALIFGYYESGNLIYAARTRNGFTPKLREELTKKFRGITTDECPSANLPEARSGRWGAGLTAAKMKDCIWLKPVLVGQFEFVEWTSDNHLRHSRFIALREDKKAGDVRRETLTDLDKSS